MRCANRGINKAYQGGLTHHSRTRALPGHATIFWMKPIHGVRVFWSACIVLFIAALVGLRWGAQISIALLSPPQRIYADPDLLHSIWIKRSIGLFLLCAFCGVMGIYFSLRASDIHHHSD